jgi:pentose-5-phosphate-3-epimerase
LLETGELAKRTDRGKHTTRQAELWPLLGGAVLDTPAFRSLNWRRFRKRRSTPLAKFVDAAKQCRFAGCRHIKEPVWAIKALIGSGRLTQARFDRYIEISQEIEQRRKNTVMIKIAPSILSADFNNLGREIERLSEWNAEWITLTSWTATSYPICRSGRRSAHNPTEDETALDVHLMVEEPPASSPGLSRGRRTSFVFTRKRRSTCIARFNRFTKAVAKLASCSTPGTPAVAVKEVLPYCDLVLVMSVNPGFGGSNHPEALERCGVAQND